jgi:cold shock protein
MKEKKKMQGQLKMFSSERGFGFIAGDDEIDYFVHQNNFVPRTCAPQVGDHVVFDAAATNKGPCARNVHIEDSTPAGPPPEFAAGRSRW